MTSLFRFTATLFAFTRHESLLLSQSLAAVLADAAAGIEQDATPTIQPPKGNDQ